MKIPTAKAQYGQTTQIVDGISVQSSSPDCRYDGDGRPGLFISEYNGNFTSTRIIAKLLR